VFAFTEFADIINPAGWYIWPGDAARERLALRTISLPA
jgi:hypothetical protein